ncbi:hypothetical protein Nmel_018170 [Mimus melanotis]
MRRPRCSHGNGRGAIASLPVEAGPAPPPPGRPQRPRGLRQRRAGPGGRENVQAPAAAGRTDGHGSPAARPGPRCTAGASRAQGQLRTGRLRAGVVPGLCPIGILPRSGRGRLPPRRRHERAVDQPTLLPLLLPALPQPHRGQARLPAPGAHLRHGARARARGQHRLPARRRGPLEAALEGPGGFPVLPAGAGQHRGVRHQEQPGEPRRLHVRPLRARSQVHGALLPWQRRGPGADEQLLHRAGHPHQLQHLLLRLLGLRREHGQALGAEPLLRHRRCMAGAAHTAQL